MRGDSCWYSPLTSFLQTAPVSLALCAVYSVLHTLITCTDSCAHPLARHRTVLPQGFWGWPFTATSIAQVPFLNPGPSVLTCVIPSFQECYVNSQCNLLRLFSPTQYNSPKIHLNCCIYQQFAPFHCWGVFHGVFHITQKSDCSFWPFRGGGGCTAQLSRS